MTRSQSEILAELATFSAPNDDWGRLDAVMQELWREGCPENAIQDLLSVFCRYPPEEDGCEVFWSIIHGVESLPNYESTLVESVDQCPSSFGVLMIARQVNGGVTSIGSYVLLDLLRNISLRNELHPEIRRAASKVVTRFTKR